MHGLKKSRTGEKSRKLLEASKYWYGELSLKAVGANIGVKVQAHSAYVDLEGNLVIPEYAVMEMSVE